MFVQSFYFETSKTFYKILAYILSGKVGSIEVTSGKADKSLKEDNMSERGTFLTFLNVF